MNLCFCEKKGSKDSPRLHLWNPFLETVPEHITESYCKGAPMKVPTRLTRAEKKPFAPVRRRPLSERSRWLVKTLPSAAGAMRRAIDCRPLSCHPHWARHPKAFVWLCFQSHRLWSFEVGAKGEKDRNSSLEGLCLTP